ncbi:ribonuclease domain-containing protein [Granulicoccus sp. GXG6511]|uniref:ribonuclease domain-containing protein n=1 Tax=Granulicoccus sp. GXG6511 TaxID=3381351 RepID=UPI003D7CD94B
MTAGTPSPGTRRGPRSWALVAVLLVVALGAWWLLGGGGGEDPRTQTTPAPTSISSPPTTTPGQPATDAQTGRPTPPRRTQASRAETIDPVSGLPWIAVADLPREARQTLTLIDRGGPFPYDKDGSTFGNFEGILPQERRGYYREYTVDTPGSRNRGARRIVTGDNDRIHYWTDDHYETFKRIRR